MSRFRKKVQLRRWEIRVLDSYVECGGLVLSFGGRRGRVKLGEGDDPGLFSVKLWENSVGSFQKGGQGGWGFRVGGGHTGARVHGPRRIHEMGNEERAGWLGRGGPLFVCMGTGKGAKSVGEREVEKVDV